MNVLMGAEDAKCAHCGMPILDWTAFRDHLERVHDVTTNSWKRIQEEHVEPVNYPPPGGYNFLP